MTGGAKDRLSVRHVATLGETPMSLGAPGGAAAGATDAGVSLEGAPAPT